MTMISGDTVWQIRFGWVCTAMVWLQATGCGPLVVRKGRRIARR